MSDEVDPLVVADLVMSYAWVHLLTGRLDEKPADLRRAVRLIVGGVARSA